MRRECFLIWSCTSNIVWAKKNFCTTVMDRWFEKQRHDPWIGQPWTHNIPKLRWAVCTDVAVTLRPQVESKYQSQINYVYIRLDSASNNYWTIPHAAWHSRNHRILSIWVWEYYTKFMTKNIQQTVKQLITYSTGGAMVRCRSYALQFVGSRRQWRHE